MVSSKVLLDAEDDRTLILLIYFGFLTIYHYLFSRERMRDTSVAGHLYQIWRESCCYSVNMAFKLPSFGLLELPSTVQQGSRVRTHLEIP